MASAYVAWLQTVHLEASFKYKADACPKFNVGKDGESLEDFRYTHKLGRGSFAEVFRAEWTKHVRPPVAVKILPRMFERTALNEKRMLFSLKHVNIVECKGYFVEPDTIGVGLIMEFAPYGTFDRLMKDEHGNPAIMIEATAKRYIAQIVLGLEYLHATSLIHGDIKPGNLLIFDGGRVKIADFGLSRFEKFLTCTISGTKPYLAPESWEFKRTTDAVDWWSLGVILLEVLHGAHPFYERGDTELTIKDKIFKWNPEIKVEGLSEDCKDLICRLLERLPSQRLGSYKGYKGSAVKDHHWFKGVSFDAMLREDYVQPGFNLSRMEGNDGPYKHEGSTVDAPEIDPIYSTVLDIGPVKEG